MFDVRFLFRFVRWIFFVCFILRFKRYSLCILRCSYDIFFFPRVQVQNFFLRLKMFVYFLIYEKSNEIFFIVYFFHRFFFFVKCLPRNFFMNFYFERDFYYRIEIYITDRSFLHRVCVFRSNINNEKLPTAFHVFALSLWPVDIC